MIVLAFNTVVVHAGDLCVGKSLIHQFLDLFGAEILLRESMTAAGGTGMDHRVGCATVMAGQRIPGFVVGERYIAVLAMWDPSTGVADQVRGIAPAVLEQDHLFLLLQRGFNRCKQRGA